MARRGNNEGSIYKRADGRWAAVINLGWQDGKRKRKTFYGRTRREVQDPFTKALRARQQSLPRLSASFSTPGWWGLRSQRCALGPSTRTRS